MENNDSNVGDGRPGGGGTRGDAIGNEIPKGGRGGRGGGIGKKSGGKDERDAAVEGGGGATRKKKTTAGGGGGKKKEETKKAAWVKMSMYIDRYNNDYGTKEDDLAQGKTKIIGQGTAPVLVPVTLVFLGLFSHILKIKPTLDNTLVDITPSFFLL